MRGLVVVVVIILAGCAETPVEADPGPEPEPALLVHAEPEAVVETMPVQPLFVEVTGELRSKAAEIQVPAGEYRLVHVVYDDNIWGESSPWDGDAETRVGVAWRMPGDGTYMHAFGFQPPPFVEDRTIRPYIDFYPMEGDGWSWSWISSSCSGCDGGPPRHEGAYLIGSPEANVTLRIGVLTDTDPEVLWGRASVAIREDAATQDAWAGMAIRGFILGNEFHSAAGVIEAEWTGASLPSGAGVERESSYRTHANITEAGITSFRFTVQETAGIDAWGYTLKADGVEGALESQWIHGPYAGLPDGAVVHRPAAQFQGVVGPGPLEAEAHRSFTGQSDPTGLAMFSIDTMNVGHAGVDLDALFGWDSDVSLPSGGAMCTKVSWAPHVTCVGDLEEILQMRVPHTP